VFLMKLIRINPSDNVAVALEDIEAGEPVELAAPGSTAAGEGTWGVALERIPRGHKIALTDIAAGGPIIKYGCAIASATMDIKKGSWVHTHNAATRLSESAEYEYHHVIYPAPEMEPDLPKTFSGYRRPDGRVGIRNELWIIPIVGCVNDIAKNLVERNLALADIPGIDGIHYWPHPYGCSQLGDDLKATAKLLAALAHHPNAGGVLCLSLGCENLTPEKFREALGPYDANRVRFLVGQDAEDEIEEGSHILKELAEYVSGFRREELPLSELVVGLKCGGSDGLSGITANPAVGCFSDLLCAAGGTTILTEVPEMFGAESILFPRCRDEQVFTEAVSMVNRFKKYFTDHGQTVYENPSPGNKAGGITTLEDKSCGCVQKGGTSQITGVLGYADAVKEKGLNLLYGPGNDLVSATNLTAAGAQMILFTTGRGTPFGAPAPTVKISTNTALFRKKSGWIDFNAGTIAEGKETSAQAGKRLFRYVIEVASGRQVAAEKHDCRGIAIMKDGVVL
jgi:altronate hydrolase